MQPFVKPYELAYEVLCCLNHRGPTSMLELAARLDSRPAADALLTAVADCRQWRLVDSDGETFDLTPMGAAYLAWLAPSRGLPPPGTLLAPLSRELPDLLLAEVRMCPTGHNAATLAELIGDGVPEAAISLWLLVLERNDQVRRAVQLWSDEGAFVLDERWLARC